jgi:hypothetical protein
MRSKDSENANANTARQDVSLMGYREHLKMGSGGAVIEADGVYLSI